MDDAIHKELAHLDRLIDNALARRRDIESDSPNEGRSGNPATLKGRLRKNHREIEELLRRQAYQILRSDKAADPETAASELDELRIAIAAALPKVQSEEKGEIKGLLERTLADAERADGSAGEKMKAAITLMPGLLLWEMENNVVGPFRRWWDRIKSRFNPPSPPR